MRVKLLIILFIFVGFCGRLLAQSETSSPIKIPPIIHYFPDSTHRKATNSYFNQRAENLKKQKPQAIQKNLTTEPNNSFILKFKTVPSPEVKAVFKKATDIWSEYIVTGQPIVMEIEWDNLGKNVLGSAGPAQLYYLLSNFTDPNLAYPVSLADKLYLKDVNENGQADIVASFNSNFKNWYIGTEGYPSNNQIDLLSVVIHEIGHGLGFISGIVTDTTISNSWMEEPTLFDSFIQNASNSQVYNNSTYANNGSNLYHLVTSDSLYQSSPAIIQKNTEKAKLYAPLKYAYSSSISHVDNNTYPVGDPNALMTPIIAYGETTREIGPIVKGLFKDFGWTKPGIYAAKMPNIERNPNGYTFKATAKFSKSENDTITNVQLYVSNGKTLNFYSRPLTRIGNEYSYTLPNQDTLTEIRYLWQGTDGSGQNISNPVTINTYKSFQITAPDHSPPTVQLDSVKYLLSTHKYAYFKAGASDNQGIQKVELKYKTNKSNVIKSTLMDISPLGENNFEGNINVDSLQLLAGDTLFYKVVATDVALTSNTSQAPASGWFYVIVSPIKTPVIRYGQTFDHSFSSSDFILDGFKIVTPSGFSGNSINSPHPYSDNKKFEAILTRPIILEAGNGLLSYDQLVISEPSFDELYVQASNDGGNSWITIGNKIDAGLDATWNTYYSNYATSLQPNPSIIKTRNLNLLTETGFTAGENILIRFIFDADISGNSWGTLIDNLKIQGQNASISTLEIPNSAPVIQSNSITISNFSPIGSNVSFQSSDADNDLLLYDLLEGNNLFHLSRSGTLSISSNPNAISDVDSITIQVSDGQVQTIKKLSVNYCETNPVLTGNITNLTKTYYSNQNIISSQKLFGNSKVKYQAIDQIKLQPEFKAEEGVKFQTQLGFGCKM